MSNIMLFLLTVFKKFQTVDDCWLPNARKPCDIGLEVSLAILQKEYSSDSVQFLDFLVLDKASFFKFAHSFREIFTAKNHKYL